MRRKEAKQSTKPGCLRLLCPLLAGLALCQVAGLGFASGQASGPAVLDGTVTIVCSDQNPQAVHEAVNDLASDLEKVFGKRPRVANTVEKAGGTVLLVGEYKELPQAMRPVAPADAESSSIAIAQAAPGAPANARRIVLAGPDMRGTIYAIYDFAEDYLGVDPMYFWTGKEPVKHDRIEIPGTLQRSYPAPVFKYRGFFLNDEDLLTGWAPGEKDKAGISLEVWNKVYETILRLHGNMVVPGSWIFPDDPQVGLAGRRGLIVNQHHATPLGVNAARWPKDVPYNYTTHPEILERAWKNAVASYAPGQEILWSVGLRGLSDVSYASMDPSVQNNDKALGALIGKAIADEMRIVRAAHPDAKFVTNLWSEATKLVQQGYLKIPPDVIQVWADNGYGFPQDKGQVKAGQGSYYHVAMMNSRANQLTEMVPVERIARELGRYKDAGATGFLLLNTSDIRPVLMTTKAVMDIAYRGALPDGGTADAFYRQWATDEFGQKAAPALTAIYKEYFAAPVHFGPEPLEYGDQAYHQEATQMLLLTMVDAPVYYTPGQAPKWEAPRLQGTPGHAPAKEWVRQTAAREIQQCGQAQARWDAVWKKAVDAEALVEPDRRPFYHAQVLAMIGINRESNRILYLVSQAIQLADAGKKADARKALAQALVSFDEIHRVEADAEYGPWKNWYRGDWLTNINSTREYVESYSRFLDDPLTHVPLPIFPRDWEAYYHIMHYEGDRTVDLH
jgi:hypothetical protein